MPAAILIGPPGAGKSTVGKALARRLELPFTDTDHLIEEVAGKKISDIFVEDGEPYFRDLEEKLVSQAIRDTEGVLSLGGGAVMRSQTQRVLEAHKDKVIFLEVSISQAAHRVGFNKERPLLAINPRQAWQSLMEQRLPVYRSLCGFSISTDSMKPAEVAEKIEEYLEAQ